MKLVRLRLRQFRAHADTSLEFAPRLNLIHGPNGAGKTNIIEAIHYLGLGRSPFAATDAPVLRRGAAFFEVEGELEPDRGSNLRIRVVYVPESGKRAFVNGAPLDRLVDLVGRVPVVSLSPSDHALTAGGPEERRRFLDSTISQATPAYLSDLVKYRRALRQRNALLQDPRREGTAAGSLPAWDAELVNLGSRVIERRRRFMAEFDRHVGRAFELLGLSGETPRMEYRTAVPLDGSGEADIADSLRRALARVARSERLRRRTLVGPHLDEIVFHLNQFEVRPFASQGQHRSFGLALRLGSFLYLKEVREETPLLLLDDAFGPLDEPRSRKVLDLLAGDVVGQSVVTAARPEPFREIISFDGVLNGEVAVASGSVVAHSRSESPHRAAPPPT
jgi:DNA replication and repair protein RecF